jgi:type I restriction enzyme M protein
MNFEQIFKNIDDVLYKDAGADSELDYIEQTSWVLFLCYLSSLEEDRKDEAELRGEAYTHIIEEEYRWSTWAMPQNDKDEYDQKNALTGPDLIDFVDGELFPYLRKFKLAHQEHPQTLEYKIGEIFGELKNRVQSGYNMRDVLEGIDTLPLKNSKDRHELSFLYETKIKNMGNAGRNGGQYYTPRPLIRAMIAVTNPQIGETIYDGAAGSCGFLCEAYEYLHDRMERTTANLATLQQRTLYGREKKSLAYIIGVMNMILHGIEAPNLIHINTLAAHDKQVQQKDRYDIVLANPPFGGKERPEVQQPFDIKTSETAFLFLEHFIRYLKTGGRAAIVIKNTFLSNTDNASVSLRKYLLETCNLHTVLDMPGGTFLGAGVKTVVLFFEKGSPTTNTWYYQLDPGRNMGKTNPLNDKDLAEFVKLQKTRPETEQSWNVPVIASKAKQSPTKENGYDLSVKNPNTPEEAPLRAPQQILVEMEQLDQDTRQLLDSIKELI